MCCSCLSIADQWRLKNSTKGMEKQFSLNRMSSENEEFSLSKWNFPLLLRVFTRPIKGRFLLYKHRYSLWICTFLPIVGIDFPLKRYVKKTFISIGFSNLANVQSGGMEDDIFSFDKQSFKDEIEVFSADFQYLWIHANCVMMVRLTSPLKILSIKVVYFKY